MGESAKWATYTRIRMILLPNSILKRGSRESIMLKNGNQLFVVLILSAVILPAYLFAQPQQGGGQGMGPGFPAMDTNKDGQISKAEWKAHSDDMFKRMDTNNDGKITRAEYQAFHHGNKKKMGKK